MHQFTDPQIKNPWLFQTGDDADYVYDHREQDHPKTFENEKKLSRENPINDEIAVGHATEHLWPRYTRKNTRAIKL